MLSLHLHVGKIVLFFAPIPHLHVEKSFRIDGHIARLLRTGEGLMITSSGLRIYGISSTFRTFLSFPFWGLMLTSPSVEIDGLMRASSFVARL